MDALFQAVELLRNQQNKVQKTKGGDCASNEKKYKPCPTLLSGASYSLNKSQSKHVSVGLQAYGGFPVVIQIRGTRNDWVQFLETEWIAFLEQQGILSNYFYSSESQWSPLNLGQKTILFQKVDAKRILRIQDRDGPEVCLGQESLEELWQLLRLLEFRVQTLKDLDFEPFYTNTIKRVADQPGDFRSNIVYVLESVKLTIPHKAVCMHEMLKYSGDVVIGDIEVEHFGRFA